MTLVKKRQILKKSGKGVKYGNSYNTNGEKIYIIPKNPSHHNKRTFFLRRQRDPRSSNRKTKWPP